MSVRTTIFVLLAALSAALFIRLGVWQIGRLHEKQARNKVVAQQQVAAAVPVAALPRDTSQVHYRLATISGRLDYEHELVVSNRTRRGSPGVDLLTPMRQPGSDTAVLVNRGWVYSPDATSVDRARWREADTISLTGFAELYSVDANLGASADPRVVRRVSAREVGARLPYPVAPFYLVAVGDTANLAHPARRETPALDDGPHRGYAFQWFAFAAIALIGAGVVVHGARKTGGTESVPSDATPSHAE